MLWVVLATPLLIAAWVTSDLTGPWRSDIRVFDPDEVARLDAAMWRSYYDRQPVPLFLQLADVLRRQFHVPLLRSFVVAAHGAKAAFVFKSGHERGQYERALPDLRRYFTDIRALSTTPFDVEETAKLELEWWIAHRARAGEDSLAVALDRAAAALYGVAADRLEPYGHERAIAMIMRDGRGDEGVVTEDDWAAIRGHLRLAWIGLAKAVTPTTSAAIPHEGGTR
jgi:hypothetical protein